MKKPKVARVAIGLPVEGPFDYAVGRELQSRIAIGQRVRITFNRRERVGFVVGACQRSAFTQLNPILSLLDDVPVLDARAIRLTKALSDFYGCSLGEAIETYLPAALRRDTLMPGSDMPLSYSVKPASGSGRMTLIHDQTRSGRWPLIIDRVRNVMEARKSVIILVPEVSFIKGVLTRLTESLSCPIALYGVGLTPKEELAQWDLMRRGEISVALGTRSAVFAPFAALGLIVVDEEENSAYKQEQAPHYHIHEVAAMRAKIDRCSVIFISSAPSVETWQKARRLKWERITIHDENPAAMHAVDMNNYNPGKTSIISFPLQGAIQGALERRGSVILFMNRRGFSVRTRCQQCGFTIKCGRCNVNLIYLYSKKVMVCRHCNSKMDLPKVCPQCAGSYLRSTGAGIEKLESEAARLYPGARVGRYDRESRAFPENVDILIATQAVLRRHDQWTASVVAVLDFDAQMHHFDFRSGHRAFSLLVHLKQIAGEKFLVQTRMADNYCLKAVRTMNFEKFYREELKGLKELGLPPYRHLVALGLRGDDENVVFEAGNALFSALMKNAREGIEVSDPHPDANPKLRDKYRFTILLKGKSVKSILTLVKSALKGFRKGKVIVTVNVDY